ncbi:MAG: hypothetical protein NTV34_11365 [Proteobacteria bacterium]|nr:hypothetical protein [Pseudomonadota bacterium]
MSEMADRESSKLNRKQRPRSCPECGSKNVESVGGEFFCAECDWDGVDIYARICVLGNPREHIRSRDNEEEF